MRGRKVRFSLVVPVKDLTGQRFGKIRVVDRAPSGPRWQTRWNCICDCGNTKVMQASNLTTGKSKSCGCGAEENRQTCNKQAKLSESQVRSKCLENGFDYIKGFNGINKPAWFRCHECDNEFQMQAQYAIYGIRQCPQCRTGNHGYLGEQYFEARPHLKDVPCRVYLLKLQSDTEEFWKIGITRRPLDQRIRQMPYKVIESESVETTFYRAYLLEKDLKQAIKRYRYTPTIDFGGWTECFQPAPLVNKPSGLNVIK